MTDLEITKLCAQAMGYTLAPDQTYDDDEGCVNVQLHLPDPVYTQYLPLHDDAQAMALVKKLGICVAYNGVLGLWRAWYNPRQMMSDPQFETINADLNRAVCECAAKMELAKKGAA